MPAETEILSNQESILANHAKIVANQETIERYPSKLDKIAADQAAIL